MKKIFDPRWYADVININWFMFNLFSETISLYMYVFIWFIIQYVQLNATNKSDYKCSRHEFRINYWAYIFWRLQMSEQFSIGTKHSKQRYIYMLDIQLHKSIRTVSSCHWFRIFNSIFFWTCTFSPLIAVTSDHRP